MTASNYWLARWLDENEIRHEWELDHLLHTQSGGEGLIEAVFRASQETRESGLEYTDTRDCNDSIVAGRKLDLSGMASCPAYECLRQGIDSTLKRVWHYFDRIVVEGLSPIWTAEEIRKTDAEHFPLTMMKIRDQARLFLYLREIGADNFVIFAPKSHAFCEKHWDIHARELGLAVVVDDSHHDDTVRRIIKSSDFLIRESHHPDGWHVTITGKYFDRPEYATFFHTKEGGVGDPPTPEEIACSIISNRATAMISDVGLARRLELPLVEPVDLPWISQRKANIKSVEDNSAIRIGLPVFDNLTTKDFLKLREDERPDFEAYRAGLQREIQSRIAKNPSKPPAAIAKDIEDEYLRPGLAKIEKQIRSRRSATLKKTSVNLAIGTSVTAIGAMASMPLLVEGLAAFGSAIPLAPIIHKFIDDGESIKMSELYFLWQAERQAKHR